MRRVLLVTAGVLALSACQKKEAAEGTPSAVKAAEPAAATAPAALGVRKAGLWTQSIAAEGMNQSMKMCLDEAKLEDADMAGSKMTRDKCSEHSVTPTAGGWKFHSVCDMGSSGTVTSDGVATGNSDGYKMELTSTTTGSSMPQANGTRKMTMQAKWEGPCPAGMKPGDIQVNGMTINAGGAGPMAGATAEQRAAMAKAMAAAHK